MTPYLLQQPVSNSNPIKLIADPAVGPHIRDWISTNKIAKSTKRQHCYHTTNSLNIHCKVTLQ